MKKRASRQRMIFCISVALLMSLLTGLLPYFKAAAASAPVDIHEAIRQTAYSYYMRGAYIQYNSMKGNPSFFSPEEATSQRTGYVVCSAFVKNVYYDLLGVVIPQSTGSLLDYSERNVGNPEVVMFGKHGNGKNLMQVYDRKTGNMIEYENMTLDQLLPYLEVGDVMTTSSHALLVYELVRNDRGEVVDARVLESAHGKGGKHVRTKISGKLRLPGGISFGSFNHYFYLNETDNTKTREGRAEGSIQLGTLKKSGNWKNLEEGNKARYSVLRFLTEDKGKPVLTYHDTKYAKTDFDGTVISFPEKTVDRVKYPHLFIEKTADVFAGSSVCPGDVLTYRIRISNESDADYTDELTVYEDIPQLVEYLGYESARPVSFKWNELKGRADWNIGRLSAGEEAVIEYSVVVKEGTEGQTIESAGTVENIPSAVVRNPVQRRLPEDFAGKAAERFDALKDTWQGKKLINEVYRSVTGVNFGLDAFTLSSLIHDSNPASVSAYTIAADPENAFSGAVLNGYWGALSEKSYEYRGERVVSFSPKAWRAYTDPERRADTVYEEHFRTGDVLIYLNHDDVTCEYDKNTDVLTKSAVTGENGEYAYLYLEGRGFVGVNYGADGVAGTADDRNEFSPRYYAENGYSVYSDLDETDETVLRFSNYQTLFGKDCYVILRPSLVVDLNDVNRAGSAPETVFYQPVETPVLERSPLLLPFLSTIRLVELVYVGALALAAVLTILIVLLVVRRIARGKRR